MKDAIECWASLTKQGEAHLSAAVPAGRQDRQVAAPTNRSTIVEGG